MKKPPVTRATTTPIHMMTEAIRNLLQKAEQIDSPDARNPIIEKALRRLDNLAKRIDPARFDSEKAMASKNVLPNPVDLSSVPTPVLLKAARDRNRELRRRHGPYAAQQKLWP